MSLVVAMVDNGRLHVCGDLRIMKSVIIPEDAGQHAPDYFNGVLKIVPISKSVAIAYAGTVSTALDAIKFVKDAGCSSEEIPAALLKYLEENANTEECDFLVLDAKKLAIHRL